MDPREEQIFFNFPIAKFSSVKNCKDDNLNTLYKQMTNNFLRDVERKHIVVINPGRIKFLERKDAKINSMYREYLNKIGLDIHLFDLPSLYHRDNPLTLYYNFEADEFDDIYCHEFDSISKFVRENKLTKVNVYCNAYWIENFLYKYPELELYCTPTGWQYPTYWNFNFTNAHPDTITKKFWCGNWKYIEHRHAIASYLANYIEDSNFSWFYSTDSKDLRNRLWFNLDSFKYKNLLETGANILKIKSPVIMDQEITIPLDISNKETPNIDHTIVPKNQYEESFCAIVTETRFAQPFAALTEKTMQAIIHARPFVMVGPPFSLEFLKEMDWKTFDQWWDESYDLEENHKLRLEKIIGVLEYINSLSIDELKRMYIEMMPIINHNQKQLLKLQKTFQKHNIDENKYFRKLRNVY